MLRGMHQLIPCLSPAGADTVQGIWCSGGPAGDREYPSLAGQRAQTLWHVVQGVCVQGEDTAPLLTHAIYSHVCLPTVHVRTWV